MGNFWVKGFVHYIKKNTTKIQKKKSNLTIFETVQTPLRMFIGIRPQSQLLSTHIICVFSPCLYKSLYDEALSESTLIQPVKCSQELNPVHSESHRLLVSNSQKLF